MSDLLVSLLALPPLADALDRAAAGGLEVRRALAPEKHLVTRWVGEVFSPAWASEVDVSFARLPVTCFIATRGPELRGFAAYEATARNFFGPLGVAEDERGRGIGTALLLAALHAMRADGYAYAIIGGAGPADFFIRTVNATPIAGSAPGVYRGMLRGPSTR